MRSRYCLHGYALADRCPSCDVWHGGVRQKPRYRPLLPQWITSIFRKRAPMRDTFRPCQYTFAHFPHEWWPEWQPANRFDCIGLSRDLPAERAVTDNEVSPGGEQ